MHNFRRRAYRKGLLSETLAALYLICKGYRILHRRYKTKVGEIDLITRKGNVVAFVEVKGRATKPEALYAVTGQNKRRIERAAAHYIGLQEQGADITYRFDVIAVGSKWPFLLKHLDNAWQLPS